MARTAGVKWKWIGLAVLAVVAVAVAAFALVPDLSVTSARTPAPTLVAAPKVPRVVLVGDSYTGTTKMGGAGDKQWTKLIQAKLYASNQRSDWDVTTLGGSGYINTGTANKNFAAGVEEPLMGNADIAILFGSRNDATSPLADVQAAAPKTINRFKERNPSAKLIVIGPTWITGNPPANLLAMRDAIKDATVAAGGTFVDPLADGWFFGPDARFIGSDGVHPTDEGNQYLADKILPAITAALTK